MGGSISTMDSLTTCRFVGRIAGIAALAASLFLAGCENRGNAPTVQTSPPPPPPLGRTATPLPGSAPVPPPPMAQPLPAPAPEPVAPPTPEIVISGATRGIPASMIDSAVRVAMLLPLSGSRGGIGQSMLDAAMLALNDVADGKFVLLPLDTRGSDRGAALAAQGAVDNKAEIVLGPLFSTSVSAAAPVVRRAGLNIIAFSNNRIVAEPGVFLAGLLPETQIDRVIGYADKRGIRRVGALIPAGAFGERVLAAARENAARLSLDIVKVGYFSDDATQTADAVRRISDFDLRRQELQNQIKALEGATDEVSKQTLEKLQKLETFGPLPFDALIVGASGQKLTEVAAQLGNFDVDTKQVRLLGLASWGASGTGREPALVGAWYADSPAAGNDDFIRNYKAMYEREPHPLAIDAYDIIALAAILGSRAPEARFSAGTLTSSSGFAGSGGLFRLLPSGLPERALEVREVTLDGSRVIEPAPAAFPAPPTVN
jgi:branched-chain amino acid transport system substrate-binding protein